MNQSQPNQPDIPGDRLLCRSDAAYKLGITDRSLWTMTVPRGPIPSVQVGRRVLYSSARLDEWIADQMAAAEAKASVLEVAK